MTDTPSRCPKCGAEQSSWEELMYLFSCGSFLGKTSGNFRQSNVCKLTAIERENRHLTAMLMESFPEGSAGIWNGKWDAESIAADLARRKEQENE